MNEELEELERCVRALNSAIEAVARLGNTVELSTSDIRIGGKDGVRVEQVDIRVTRQVAHFPAI